MSLRAKTAAGLAMAAAIVSLLAGCDRREAASAPPPTPVVVASAATAPVAQVAPASGASSPAGADGPAPWVGRWYGPEGTWLALARDGQGWSVTIHNLDGPRTFAARVDGGRLRFERDGVTETVREGSGVDTGMKWLADQTECLVVRDGEGFCRR